MSRSRLRACFRIHQITPSFSRLLVSHRMISYQLWNRWETKMIFHSQCWTWDTFGSDQWRPGGRSFYVRRWVSQRTRLCWTSSSVSLYNTLLINTIFITTKALNRYNLKYSFIASLIVYPGELPTRVIISVPTLMMLNVGLLHVNWLIHRAVLVSRVLLPHGRLHLSRSRW